MSNARNSADLLRAKVPPHFVTITPGAAVTLDTSYGQTIGVCDALANNCTISTLNLAAGRVYGLRVRDNGTQRTLTFPGTWVWLTTAPTATAINKWVVITIESRGTTDSMILADWKVQP
jgi:hypothetical protein